MVLKTINSIIFVWLWGKVDNMLILKTHFINTEGQLGIYVELYNLQQFCSHIGSDSGLHHYKLD